MWHRFQFSTHIHKCVCVCARLRNKSADRIAHRASLYSICQEIVANNIHWAPSKASRLSHIQKAKRSTLRTSHASGMSGQACSNSQSKSHRQNRFPQTLPLRLKRGPEGTRKSAAEADLLGQRCPPSPPKAQRWVSEPARGSDGCG